MDAGPGGRFETDCSDLAAALALSLGQIVDTQADGSSADPAASSSGDVGMLMEITGADEARCAMLLEAAGGDVPLAATLHFDGAPMAAVPARISQGLLEEVLGQLHYPCPHLRSIAELREAMQDDELAKRLRGEFCWSLSFDRAFISALLYEGFLPIASECGARLGLPDSLYVLQPKLHVSRCLLDFQNLHVSRKARKAAKRYTLTISTAFDDVLQACIDQHGENWLYPPVRQVYSSLAGTPQPADGPQPLAISFELWRDADAAPDEPDDAQNAAEHPPASDSTLLSARLVAAFLAAADRSMGRGRTDGRMDSKQAPPRHKESVMVRAPNYVAAEKMRVTIASTKAYKQNSAITIPNEWYIIDPRKSKNIFVWDSIAALALIYVAIVTPFEVGYLDAAKNEVDSLFILNRVIDGIFIIDMVIQFFLMVEIAYEGEIRWIASQKLIRRHYLRTWFTLDLICVLVSIFDYLPFWMNTTNGGGVDSVENLRLLRVLRTLRLMKLAKLLSSLKIVKRYEVKVAINYAALSLIKCLVGMILIAHWFACIWGLQATFADSKLNTWLGAGDYCVSSTVTGLVACVDPSIQYIAGLYWSVMTITSIGYGDIAATSGNTGEQMVAIVIMIIGSIGQGLVLGTIVSNLSNLDPEGDEFTSTMTELNKMMSREGLRNDLRIRLREYFHETSHLRRADKRSELLQLMSPTLRSEVAWEVNKVWLGRVWFLRGGSLTFLVQLSLMLRPMVFAPGEIAPVGMLYIVNRGLGLYAGMIYNRGRYWGEDVILTSEHLRLSYCALALNFLETFRLGRSDLENVAAIFPSMARKLRRHAIRLACRRAFVMEANLRKNALALAEESTDARPIQSMPKELTDAGSFMKLGSNSNENEALDQLQKARDHTVAKKSMSIKRRISTFNGSNKVAQDGARASKVSHEESSQAESAAAALGAAMATSYADLSQSQHLPGGPRLTGPAGPGQGAFGVASQSKSTPDASSSTNKAEQRPNLLGGVIASVFSGGATPNAAASEDISPIINAAVGALRDELRPLLETILANQASLTRDNQRQRDLLKATSDDVNHLRGWIATDVFSKLQA